MFSHALAAVLLVAPADVPDNSVKATSVSAEVTRFTVDDMTFSGRAVQFSSAKGLQTCTVEGDAKMNFGDITITAERIQFVRKAELHSIVCTGECTWRQDDGNGELLSADKLELEDGTIRLAGNASLQYGAGDHKTVITCDSIATSKAGYQFSGTVRLQHGE